MVVPRSAAAEPLLGLLATLPDSDCSGELEPRDAQPVGIGVALPVSAPSAPALAVSAVPDPGNTCSATQTVVVPIVGVSGGRWQRFFCQPRLGADFRRLLKHAASQAEQVPCFQKSLRN